MRLSRFFWFLISILFGIAAGLVIGWYVKPISMGEVSPPALRSDYRTDYILMVAEIYNVEKDLPKAVQRLTYLGEDTPVRLSQVAIIRAGELGYDQRDLELLAKLVQALLGGTTGSPTAGAAGGSPAAGTITPTSTVGARP